MVLNKGITKGKLQNIGDDLKTIFFVEDEATDATSNTKHSQFVYLQRNPFVPSFSLFVDFKTNPFGAELHFNTRCV